MNNYHETREKHEEDLTQRDAPFEANGAKEGAPGGASYG